MHQLIVPEPFSEEIMKKANALRATLDIPSCLDSPFFIARFLRANNGDVELSKRRISEYLIHRRTLGYADYDDLGIFTEFPIGKATFERFRISLIDYDIKSKDVHVFIQKMEGTDIKEIMKVIPLSYVLHSYYCLHENFGRAVAHTEKKTGRPSSVVSILDLSGLNIADFLNPLSSPVKLARLVVKIWSEYFSENLCKLLIINPPGIVSLMWQISKCIMDSKTASRLAFLHNVEELKNYLEPEAIPVEYGGLWRDDSGYADPPEGCCRKNKPPLGSEHKGPDDIWTVNGILRPPTSKTYNIKAHQQVEITRKCSNPGTLIWNFTVAGDVEFEILKREASKEVTVWPRITLTSLKLPEFGAIPVAPGEYILRFQNPSSTWFPIKLSCATEIKQE